MPRGRVNAEALLAAAHRLVLERGENFTTQELVREADVALQTFYRHFGGKDQLLVAVVGDLIRGHCDALRDRAASISDPVERLRFFVIETLDVLANNPQGTSGARFMTSQHWRLHQTQPAALAEATRAFADLVQQELEAATAAGSLASANPERDAWLVNKLVMAAFHHYAFAEDDPTVTTAAEDIWRFCLAAVGGSPSNRSVSRRRTPRGASR